MPVERGWSVREAVSQRCRYRGDVCAVAVAVWCEGDDLVLAECTEGLRKGEIRVRDDGEREPAEPEVVDPGVHRSGQTKSRSPQDESTLADRKIRDGPVVTDDKDRHTVTRRDDTRSHIACELLASVVCEDCAEAHLCTPEGLDRDDKGAHLLQFTDEVQLLAQRICFLRSSHRPRQSRSALWLVSASCQMPGSVANHGGRGVAAGTHQRERVTKIAVLGAGSWGTTIASLLSTRAQTVLWARSDAIAKEVRDDHTNTTYLGAHHLPEELAATSSLGEALDGASLVVLAVPSHGVRTVLDSSATFIGSGVPVLSLTKGLEEHTLLRMTQVVGECWPGRPLGVLTGPNLASEVLSGMPTASVIAMSDEEIGRDLQGLFASETLRVYTNPDVIGCELAGAVKNVMAIASGMAIGLGLGDNTRAALITRSLAEITRLGVACGGEPLTFAGLAGVGDLVATCTSPMSRNFALGVALGRGQSLVETLGGTRMIAEGVKTCRPIVDLATSVKVEVPVSEQVVAVCFQGRSPAQTIPWLMGRAAKSEMHGLVSN